MPEEDIRDSRLDKAREAFGAGDFHTAKIVALSIIARDLVNEEARELSALASEAAGEFLRAAIARSQLGTIQNSGREFEKAASAYLKIGNISSALYSYNQALRCYQDSIQNQEWERVNSLVRKLSPDQGKQTTLN